MKNKGLLITAIVLFLLVNTTYYWEGKLGSLAILAAFILVIAYIALFIALIRQLYFVVREKLINKQRLILISFLAIVLGLIFYRPSGLIDFDKLEGKDVLVAEREGVANCMTVLKLKDNFTFKKTDVCFGVTDITGKYHLKNDTIYFDNTDIERSESDFYEFAIIKPSIYNKDGKHFDVALFKSTGDSLGNELPISKNELYLLKDKK